MAAVINNVLLYENYEVSLAVLHSTQKRCINLVTGKVFFSARLAVEAHSHISSNMILYSPRTQQELLQRPEMACRIMPTTEHKATELDVPYYTAKSMPSKAVF